MTTIALIGAGSAVFSKNILADILWHDALKDTEFRLMDVDPERLETTHRMALSINRSLGTNARFIATRDRKRALDGADFVISTIGVGGLAATRDDLLIPLKHGLRQTIGDTLGIGGIFRAARSIPVLLDICADMKALCPDAFLINYTNPMAMHCLAVERATSIRHVGLCHGVQNTAQVLRMYVEMLRKNVSANAVYSHFHKTTPERVVEWTAWWALGADPTLNYVCAGINHMAFFLKISEGGRDLYPEIRRALQRPHLRRLDDVRAQLFDQLGYFMTETSAHTAEYLPYFLKDDREIERHHLRIVSYIKACEDLERAFRKLQRDLKAGRPVIGAPYRPSNEYISRIVNAMVTDRPFVFNGNVHNRGGAVIGNLPGDACVEVPCMANRFGVSPTTIGALPPACAALIRTNINVQDLAVRGILEGNKDYLYQAAMLDPNTASQLTLDGIRRLCDAMFKAHRHRLPKALR